MDGENGVIFISGMGKGVVVRCDLCIKKTAAILIRYTVIIRYFYL